MNGKKVEIVLAPGPNALVMSPDEKGKVAGFWRGFLHGSIAPITFIISLFNHNVHMYEVHNNGGWYNFGYLLGLSVIFGGSRGGAGAAGRAKAVRRDPSQAETEASGMLS